MGRAPPTRPHRGPGDASPVVAGSPSLGRSSPTSLPAPASFRALRALGDLCSCSPLCACPVSVRRGRRHQVGSSQPGRVSGPTCSVAWTICSVAWTIPSWSARRSRATATCPPAPAPPPVPCPCPSGAGRCTIAGWPGQPAAEQACAGGVMISSTSAAERSPAYFWPTTRSTTDSERPSSTRATSPLTVAATVRAARTPFGP
jgi:hypothetical protein